MSKNLLIAAHMTTNVVFTWVQTFGIRSAIKTHHPLPTPPHIQYVFFPTSIAAAHIRPHISQVWQDDFCFLQCQKKQTEITIHKNKGFPELFRKRLMICLFHIDNEVEVYCLLVSYQSRDQFINYDKIDKL